MTAEEGVESLTATIIFPENPSLARLREMLRLIEGDECCR